MMGRATMRAHKTSPKPALRGAILLAAGILAAHQLPAFPAPVVCFLIAGAFALACLLPFRPPAPGCLLALACVALGAGLYSARTRTVAPDSILHHLGDSPTLIEVRGRIYSTPELARSQRGALADFARYDPLTTRFTLDARELIGADGSSERVSGRLLVRITGEAREPRAGNTIRLTGLASRLRPPGNPGGFDAPAYYAQQGVVGRMTLATPDLASVESAHRTPIIETVRPRSRDFLARDAEAVNPETRALLSALLLGQRDDDIGQTGPAFRRLGIAHILAISGMHLGLVAGAMILILRLIGDHPRLEALAVLIALIGAMVLIPARAPILRAALMLGTFLAAESAGRRYDRINTLALVAIAVLIWRPLELFSPGFQLSFGAVAALLVVTPILRERLFGPRDLHAEDHLGRWLVSGAKTAFAASLCAWAATTPLAAYHFGVFTPFGAPATILLSIPVALTLVVGYASMILASIVPAFADTAHSLVFALGDLLRWMVLALDARAWSVVSLPRLSIPWTIGATMLVIWWMVRGSWREMRTIVLTVILALWTAWRIVGVSLPGDVSLRIDAFDVADGSCYLLRAGDEAIMFDCGSTWFGVGESSIPQGVRAVGSPPVRTVIISHADTDHYSALLDASGPMGVRTVLTTPQFVQRAERESGGPAAFVLRELRERGIEVRTIAQGDILSLDDASIDILWPPPDAEFARDNDASIVALVRTPTAAGERSFLLTGDIEREAIDELSPAQRGRSIDGMEAPHHGSARDFAADFIMALDPDIVIQSTGFSRLDDPRWAEVRRGRRWLATPRAGAVGLVVRANGEMEARGFREGMGQNDD